MKHDTIVKENRQKRALLEKLKAKKKEKLSRINENKEKMIEL